MRSRQRRKVVMSEEQNDSPAFRLRPRRAAPKSYYAVRLEYSANPAAFIRERPRNITKRRVFAQKSGSNSTKTALNQSYGSATPSKSTVISKEEREREERRMLLHRDASQSITTDTLISPFMQRLRLDELKPDSVYEHNYITLRIKQVQLPDADCRLLCCTCSSVDHSLPEHRVKVRLHNDYADISKVKEGKIISIAKFKTGPLIGSISHDDDNEIIKLTSSSQADSTATASHDNGSSTTTIKPIPSAQMYGSGNAPTVNTTTNNNSSESSATSGRTSTSIKAEHGNQKSTLERSSIDSDDKNHPLTSSLDVGHEIKTLPFNVIVASSGTSNNKSLLIPFVSITDMIEQPTEPYVEMSPPS